MWYIYAVKNYLAVKKIIHWDYIYNNMGDLQLQGASEM